MEALDRQLAEQNAATTNLKDGRKVVGLFDADPGFLDVIDGATAKREGRQLF